MHFENPGVFNFQFITEAKDIAKAGFCRSYNKTCKICIIFVLTVNLLLQLPLNLVTLLSKCVCGLCSYILHILLLHRVHRGCMLYLMRSYLLILTVDS